MQNRTLKNMTRIGAFGVMTALSLGLIAGCPGTPNALTLTLSGCPEGNVIAGNSFTLTATVLDSDGNDVSATSTYTATAAGASFMLGVVTQENQIEITIPAEAAAQTLNISVQASFGAAGEEQTSNTEMCSVTIEANPCGAEGDPCDDQDPCTEDDACTADFVCEGTPIDCDDMNECTDDSCDSATGECVNANNTNPCDDGDACTENDTCADGACAGEDVMCEDGEVCDPNSGDCVSVCETADDCDDDNECTDDACEINEGVGVCVNAPIDPDMECDDGDACTQNTCDPTDGCQNPPVECPGDQTCVDGECTDAPPCTEDAQCDDGVFCNGAEVCVDEVCQAGADPCGDTMCTCEGEDQEAICEEGDDSAVCSCPECPEILFTLGQDNLAGSTGDDIFSAPLQFNAATGTQVATLQTGDMANGLAGTDLLNASFTGGEAPTPGLQGIEDIRLSNFGPTPAAAGTNTAASLVTLNGTNVTGASSITSVNSTDDITVSGLQALVNFGMTNVQNAAVDMAISFAQASVTSGSADQISFTVGSTVGDGIIVVPAGVNNGIEVLDVISSGGALNTITAIRHVQNDGTPNTFLDNPVATSLTTCNFSGPAALESRILPNSVLTFDGSGMAGNWTLGSGDGSAANPYVAFHAANQSINTITGGNGDDMLIFGNQLTDADAADGGEFIDGGAGTDTLQATLAANIAAVAPFLSIENLNLNATGGARSINLTGVSGIMGVTVDGAAGGVQADAITLLNISGSPLPGVTFRGDGTQAGQGYDPLNYTATGVGGTGDTLAISVNNRGTALNQTGTANVHAVGAITGNNLEIFTLDVQDGPATFNNITGSTMSTCTATAVSNVVLGTVGTGGVGSTLTSLNFAGVVGNLTGTFNDCANGVSITGAAGNDSITVANSAAMTSSVINTGNGDDTLISQDLDSQDVISSGAGADMITPAGGNDVVTPGDGNDVVIFTSTIGGAPANSDGADQISGFSIGDILRFGAAPPALANGVAGADNMTVIGNNGTDTTVIVDLDTGGGTSFLTITLTGVTLTSANFTIQNTTDIARTS